MYLRIVRRLFQIEDMSAMQEEGKTWLGKHLREDVEKLQMMKQIVFMVWVSDVMGLR